MDSSYGNMARRPYLISHPIHHHHHHHLFPCHHHHHHHHHHFSPQCPLHSYLFRENSHPTHPHTYPQFTPPPPLPQNLGLAGSSHLSLQLPECTDGYASNSLTMQDENAAGLEEEDEEEPIFVLTDEWREFFAKSEAKRRSAKKQARKKGNN